MQTYKELTEENSNYPKLLLESKQVGDLYPLLGTRIIHNSLMVDQYLNILQIFE